MAIITTGDEIVAPGEQLSPGEIFESNGLMLAALAKRAGATVTMRSHARDEFADLCAALREGIKSDALIISGGVSVGERDLVREALKEMGVQVDLWRVKVKPGKPFLFGRHAGCAIFGLPGNPVSAFVTFMIFVRPALLRMMGANDAALRKRTDLVGSTVWPTSSAALRSFSSASANSDCAAFSSPRRRAHSATASWASRSPST